MSLNSNNNPSQEQVLQAVKDAIRGISHSDHAALALTPVPAGVHPTGPGEWVVPVASGAPGPTGHQLHRVLSDIQRDVETKLRVFVTIILDA